MVLLTGAFLALWAGSALLLSCLPWFGHRLSLADRLAPSTGCDGEAWVEDVEAWIHRQ